MDPCTYDSIAGELVFPCTFPYTPTIVILAEILRGSAQDSAMQNHVVRSTAIRPAIRGVRMTRTTTMFRFTLDIPYKETLNV